MLKYWNKVQASTIQKAALAWGKPSSIFVTTHAFLYSFFYYVSLQELAKLSISVSVDVAAPKIVVPVSSSHDRGFLLVDMGNSFFPSFRLIVFSFPFFSSRCSSLSWLSFSIFITKTPLGRDSPATPTYCLSQGKV